LRLLEDSDQMTRQRVASALARLADACPERLVRWVDRIQEALADDSAYLRWHLVYVLGRVSAKYPGRVNAQLEALIQALEDENKIVRVLSLRALAGMACVRPRAVEDAFAVQKREVPALLARVLRGARAAAELPHKR